jgi:hypothetical protein
MEMWNEDYFNMKTQAHVEVTPENLSKFQLILPLKRTSALNLEDLSLS